MTLVACAAATCARADRQVQVSAFASAAYTQGKFGGPKTRPETYVFMQGTFFPGIRVDRMLEKMTFRQVVETIAPELARQQYLPTADPKDADLLIVVHWGATKPFVGNQDLAAQSSSASDSGNNLFENAQRVMMEQNIAMGPGGITTPADVFATNQLPTDNFRQLDFDRLDQVANQLGSDLTSASNSQLLGYGRDLRRLAQSPFETEEARALNFDLTTERYFIILKAYDLREKAVPGRSRRSVWTLHLNMRSLGINFPTALGAMSTASVDFLGRSTDQVTSVLPTDPKGRVELGPLTILGEAK